MTSTSPTESFGDSVKGEGGARGRITWMDLLRGTSVLLVALFHATTFGDWTGGAAAAVTAVNNALSPYRIPTLLVLSGMLLQPSLAKGLPRYAAGKLRHVLWPYLVWAAVFPLAWGDLSGYLSIDYWLDGGYLWFLTVLLTSYLLAPLTRWVPAGLIALALLGSAVLVYAYAPSDAELLRRHLWYGSYFFAGSAFAASVPRWQRAPWLIAGVLGATALAWGVWVAVEVGYAPKGNPLHALVTLAGVAAVIWLAPRVPRMRLVRSVEWLGRSSIVLYTVHLPAMLIPWRAIRLAGLGDTWVVAPVLFFFAVGVAALATKWKVHFPWLFAFPEPRGCARVVDAPSSPHQAS